MAELKFIVTMDSSQFTEGANKVMADVKQITSSVEKEGGKIQSQFDGIGKSIGGSMSKYLAMFGGAAALKGLITEMVKVRSEFQKTDVAIRTMLGSKEKADELMNQVREYAKISPLEFGDITKATQMMISFNIEATKVPQYIKAIGDVSMGEKDRFNSLALAFSQMSATGKLMGQDLLQMINAGFNPLATISDKTGKSIAQLKDEMSKGAISAKMVQDAFIAATSAGGKFYGMSENAAKTIGGQLSMLSDAVAAAFNEVGTKTEGIITTAISGVTTMVENYEKVVKAIGVLITGYGTYKAALLTVMAVEQAHAAVQAAGSVKALMLKTAQEGVNKAMAANPYGAAALALAGLVSLITAAATSTDAFEDAQRDLDSAASNVESATAGEMAKLESLHRKMIEAGEGTEEYKRIKQQIIDQYSQYYAGLEGEWKRVGDLSLIYDKLTLSIRQAMAARQLQQFSDKMQEKANNATAKLMDKAYSAIMDKFGPKEGMKLWGSFFKYATTGAKLTADELKKLGKIDVFDFGFGKGGGLYVTKSLVTVANDIRDINNASADAIEGFKKLYKVVAEPPKVETPTITTPEYTDKKALAASQKAAEKAARERERLAKQQADEYDKIAAIHARQITEDGRAAVDLELETREMQNKAMRDGTEKTLAEIELSHDKEVVAITRWYEDLRQKRIDEAQKLFEAQKANEGKKFFESEEYKTAASDDAYTEQEKNALRERLKAANKIYTNALEDLPKAEQSAMRNYLRNYGTYQQRKLAIAQEYDQQIEDTQIEGEKKTLQKQKEAALEQVDIDFGLKTQQMADLFEDASQKSVKAIDTIIKKYEALVAYMKGANGEMTEENISRDDLLNLGFSEKDLEKITSGQIKINDITEAIKKLKDELKAKSPFKAFEDELSKALGNIKKGKTGEGLQGIGQAVNKFLPSVKEFGKNIANIFGFDDSAVQGVIDAVGGLGDAAAGVGQIMSGDIVGGIMSTAKGIGTIVNAVEGLFGADYSSYNKLVEQYDKLIDVWDDLLEKKREYLDTSYGAEALRAEKEMTDILAKETEAWRELGRERLNAGASAGSHSIGNRIIKQMSAEDWGDITKALGQNARKLLGDRLTGLFDLSSDQLSRLKEQAPAFWAKMDDDVRKYLQSIIDGAEQLDEVQKKAKEQLTQTTFEAMRDDFISKLADMESAASDFSDDFAEMLFRAMLNTKVNEMFSDRLSKWYDQFAEAMKDSEVSESERNALLADYNNIVADAVKLRDTLADATGYSQSVGEGSGAYKAASSFSQEQGDELNGRLTAIQIGQAYQNEQLTMAVMTLQSMSVVGQEQGNTIAEMRNLMLIGNSHLEDIARYTRIAAQYGDAIETIADKIKTL